MRRTLQKNALFLIKKGTVSYEKRTVSYEKGSVSYEKGCMQPYQPRPARVLTLHTFVAKPAAQLLLTYS